MGYRVSLYCVPKTVVKKYREYKEEDYKKDDNFFDNLEKDTVKYDTLTDVISSDKDYIVFKNWWSSGRFFTWTRSNNMWKVGCFYDTGEELIAKAYKDSEESGREYEKIVKYVEGVNNHYTQTLEKTWKYKIYLKLSTLKTMIAKLLR